MAKYRATSVSFESSGFHIHCLGKMLAKIAHAYAIAELGYGTFLPLLANIILNKPPRYISRYVGGLCDSEAPLGNDLHTIEIDPGLGQGRYIVVRIQLFADRKLPVYYVIVGQKF